jgi:hypothetical protein
VLCEPKLLLFDTPWKLSYNYPIKKEVLIVNCIKEFIMNKNICISPIFTILAILLVVSACSTPDIDLTNETPQQKYAIDSLSGSDNGSYEFDEDKLSQIGSRTNKDRLAFLPGKSSNKAGVLTGSCLCFCDSEHDSTPHPDQLKTSQNTHSGSQEWHTSNDCLVVGWGGAAI